LKDESMKAKAKRDKELITLRGIIIPMGWDETGGVVAIGLSGADEEEYQIETNEKKGELLTFLRKEVEVTGLLRGQIGKRVIALKTYRVM
jgi:hypothetical protein